MQFDHKFRLRSCRHQATRIGSSSPSLHHPTYRSVNGSRFLRAKQGSRLSNSAPLIDILKVIGKLKAKEDVMTTRTKEMHKSLVKVCNLQETNDEFLV